MVEVIGQSVRVVDTGLLSIDELAGNVATKNDRISIALVKVSEPTSEPWLTLHYGEWMCVVKGRMVLLHGEKTVEVLAGQTVFIAKGERFRPTFPEGGTEYIPVCLPAFRPDRCIREENGESDVSVKLQELHEKKTGGYAEDATLKIAADEDPTPEVMYHMCDKALWEEAKRADVAYFPPTFEADGMTHATAVPSRLLDVANHFYQDAKGDWVCLRFRRSALRKLGIVTKDEQAKPVGAKDVDAKAMAFVWPHVFGGIPPQVVEEVFPIERRGSVFTGIRGLTKLDRVFKLATSAEVERFKEKNRILSDLDLKDGFVHLSDANAAPVVAKMFFANVQDLMLLEVDAEKVPAPVEWIQGKMSDPAPPRKDASSVIHYLLPEGCVHVYGEQGVPWDAVSKCVPLPLKDSVHSFPSWIVQ